MPLCNKFISFKSGFIRKRILRIYKGDIPKCVCKTEGKYMGSLSRYETRFVKMIIDVTHFLFEFYFVFWSFTGITVSHT